jgi:hypothetical protein
MTNKDLDIPNKLDQVQSTIDLLAKYGIRSMSQLDNLASTAHIQDTCWLFFKNGFEYSPFAVNNAIQVEVSRFVTAFGKAHGTTSPVTILLAIMSNVMIPSVGSMAVAKAAKYQGPTYSLPDTPKYWHPGINNNPDFVPIIMMPLTTFIIADVLFSLISTLGNFPKPSTWAKPTVDIATALKQIYEVWKALQGKRKECPARYALNDSKQWFYQLWLEKGEVELHPEIINLLLPLLQGYIHKVFVNLWSRHLATWLLRSLTWVLL